jgi:hypothetical protein
MVHATGEERAVHLSREAVELRDAGHHEVGVLFLNRVFFVFIVMRPFAVFQLHCSRSGWLISVVM